MQTNMAALLPSAEPMVVDSLASSASLPDPRNMQVRELRPLPESLVEALRLEIMRLVEGKDFVQNLTQISKLAAQIRELVAMISLPVLAGGVQAGSMAVPFANQNVTYGNSYASPSYASPGQPIQMMGQQNHEQFGARAIRELVNLVPEIAGAIEKAKQRANPAGLVAAIATAKEKGLTELATRLEDKLLQTMQDGEASGDGPEKEEDASKHHRHAPHVPHAANGVSSVLSSLDGGTIGVAVQS